MAEETRQPEANIRAQLGDWARSIVARARQAQSVLSPWVQRALETGALGRRPPSALSEEHGRPLVERMTRRGESSRVWRPNLGGVSPATFDRFGSDIVRRHQPLADKYRVEVPEWDPEQSTGLVLAPASAVGPGLRPEDKQPGLAAGLPPMPSVPPSPRPAPQRQAAWPPASSQEQRAARRPPGGRVFSRVEELTPASRSSEARSPQQPGVAPEALGEEWAAADAEQATSIEHPPAAPSQRSAESLPAIEGRAPPLQRRPAEGQEAKEPWSAAPPEEAPPLEVEGRPLSEARAKEQPRTAVDPEAPHAPPSQVEAASEVPPLQREPRADHLAQLQRPSPVSPPEGKASEIEAGPRREHAEPPPVSRPSAKTQAVSAPPDSTQAVSPPEVGAAGDVPPPRREVPPLGHQPGDEQQPVTPQAVSPPEVEAPGEVPSPRQEMPPLAHQPGDEQQPLVAPRAMSPSEVEAPGEGLPLQRAPLAGQPLPDAHRVEGYLPGPAQMPEAGAEDVESTPRQEVPPGRRSGEQGALPMPPADGLALVQSFPTAGPRQPVDRKEAVEEPKGVPEAPAVTDPTLPVLRRASRAKPAERMPVQRTAILPQAWLEAQPEAGAAAPLQDGLPARGGLWREAPVTRARVSGEPQPERVELPLAVVKQMPPVGESRPEAPVQRSPLDVVPLLETAPPGEGLVQRQNGTGPAVSTAPTEEGEPDLDKLARQVYPLVKRMLAVERERRFSR